MKIRPIIFGQVSPAPTFVIHVGSDEIRPLFFGQATACPYDGVIRTLCGSDEIRPSFFFGQVAPAPTLVKFVIHVGSDEKSARLFSGGLRLPLQVVYYTAKTIIFGSLH